MAVAKVGDRKGERCIQTMLKIKHMCQRLSVFVTLSLPNLDTSTEMSAKRVLATASATGPLHYSDVRFFGHQNAVSFSYQKTRELNPLNTYDVCHTGSCFSFTDYFIVLLGFLPHRFGSLTPRKASSDRVALLNLLCMLDVLVFPSSTELRHELDYEIFNVRTDVNAHGGVRTP